MNSPADFNGAREEAVEATAAAWLAQRDDGLTPEAEAEFARWREASPHHEAAVRRLELAWKTLARLQHFRPEARSHPNRDLLAPAAPRRPAWVPALGWSLAAAAVLVLVGAWWSFRSGDHAPLDYATVAGGYQRVTLEDGSVTELNANSEIQVRYGRTERRVRLLRGEVQFTVAKNKERPFWVEAGPVTVRAVGTAFDVRLADGKVDVLVTEGKVALAHAGLVIEPILEGLVAGQRAVIAATASPRISSVETVSATVMAEALAWREDRLVFVATPLAEAVRQFNRRNQVQIELSDPSIGKLLISGSFRPDSVDAFVRLLAENEDLEVGRPAPGHILLRPAH